MTIDYNSLPTPPGPRFRRDEHGNLEFHVGYDDDDWWICNTLMPCDVPDMVNCGITDFQAEARRIREHEQPTAYKLVHVDDYYDIGGPRLITYIERCWPATDALDAECEKWWKVREQNNANTV